MTANAPGGRLSFWHPAHLIATFGGAGLIKPAPGTWGSLAALPFAWVLLAAGGPAALVLAAILLFAAGCWATAVYIDAVGGDDPQTVVVDEVVGQWLTLAVVLPDIKLFVAGFVLFRLFDIVKPWPIRTIERRTPGAFGVMLDDVLAAVYAAVFLFIASRYLGFL
ncbi:MAG: phosphatidylglycerophosphatase A [Minwuiales bacterium]|nr:phosphatidylglycerophosphatase A [Minwuiales bacterium]